MKFHPLVIDTLLPTCFNNPFDYEPDALCRAAATQLQATLPPTPTEGKMYGVLIVEHQGQIGYLQAYSGQMEKGGEDYVPAVFDYLQPGEYFKVHEEEITLLNKRIAQLKASTAYKETKEKLSQLQKEATEAIEQARRTMQEAKHLREKRRNENAVITDVEQAEMIRESQFLKAELHRTKVLYTEKITAAKEGLAHYQERITAWKRERKMKSDHLQQWLFSQFNLLNACGETKNLLTIFREYYLKNSPARTQVAHLSLATESLAPSLLPPAGAGECCEPKLLQYAFLHGYKPISMAMFWWGASPKTEIRQHRNYYPACNGKCKPILEWMLKGLQTPLFDGKAVESDKKEAERIKLETLYEDDYLAVVVKPSGLLSVPGKGDQPSVYSLLKTQWNGKSDVFIVHRLDMATSGLLVVARSLEIYKALQAQFIQRSVKKTYVALLPMSFLNKAYPSSGRIELPLSPDINDRPRQYVDYLHGKQAITD